MWRRHPCDTRPGMQRLVARRGQPLCACYGPQCRCGDDKSMHGLLRGDGTELPVQGGHRARDLCRPAYGWFPTRKYTGPMSMAAVVLVVLAAGIALAPIAHADSQSDQKFIA